MHLLVEAGCYGMSFAWYRKDPLVLHGVAVYNFNGKIMPEHVADEISKIIKANPSYTAMAIDITICYDWKENILVPAAHFDPEKVGHMLHLVHDTHTGYKIRTDQVKPLGCFNVYAVDERIDEIFNTQFHGASLFHSSSLVLQQLPMEGKMLYCIFFHNCINLFLIDDRLLFSGQFQFKKPADAAYHLLNCCAQYDIEPSSVQLRLSGMIDAHSTLYNELYKYFLHIEFDPALKEISTNERVSFYPSHFFSHLTSMISCVS